MNKSEKWATEGWGHPPGLEIVNNLAGVATYSFDDVSRSGPQRRSSSAQDWLRKATGKDRSRMDAHLSSCAESGAKPTSGFSAASCFVSLYGKTYSPDDPLVLGIAAEDVPEAAIRTGDLVGDVDGSEYFPAPADMSQVLQEIGRLGHDHYGEVGADGSWNRRPDVGGSRAFAENVLFFVRLFADRVRRKDVKRWVGEEGKECTLVELPAVSASVSV